MHNWNFLVITLSICTVVNGVAIYNEEGELIEEGLYKKSQNIVILNVNNFDRKVFGQKFALLVQFYNRNCGICRDFRSNFTEVALGLKHWNNIFRLAVIDCSVEENNRICRGYEDGFPTIRYVHEYYMKDGTLGEVLHDKIHYLEVGPFRAALAGILQADQKNGHLASAPDMHIYSYSSYKETIRGTPKNVLYTFLVFENENSFLGSELALDMNDYNRIIVKRVNDDSPLAKKAGLSNFPAVVAVNPSCRSKVIRVRRNATVETFLKCVNKFLRSKNYRVPIREKVKNESIPHDTNIKPEYVDQVFYNDLEKAIRYSLHVEVIRKTVMNETRVQALLDYLEVLIINYPFKNNNGNLKEYLTQLLNFLRSKREWPTDEVYDKIISLEDEYTPVYTSQLKHVACKGSQPYYRGQTCALWHLFHTLTVNALNQPGKEGPKVLKAMYGYTQNFFMCSGCARHFKNLSMERRLFEKEENEESMLWLWMAHNDVNNRLTGKKTEDPVYPKIKFPSASRCPECRDSAYYRWDNWDIKEGWNFPAVSQYLKSMYSPQYIKNIVRSSSYDEATENPFYSVDGMLRYLGESFLGK